MSTVRKLRARRRRINLYGIYTCLLLSVGIEWMIALMMMCAVVRTLPRSQSVDLTDLDGSVNDGVT